MCSGGLSTQCSICALYNSVQYYLLDASSCVAECGPGKYEDSITKTCKSCDPTCTTCDVTANNCFGCQSTFVLQGTQCVNACYAGFWDNNGVCSPCDSKCNTCSDGTSCINCKYPYFMSSGTCVAQGNCPSTSIENTATQTCVPCQSPCATCSGTTSFCTSCTGSNLHNGACVTNCPDGYYPSGGVCTPCTNECARCTTGSYDQCSKCRNNNYLQESTKCLPTCPSGYFTNTVALTCDLCQANCYSCGTSTTNCLSCTGNYYLHVKKKIIRWFFKTFFFVLSLCR